MAKIRGIKPEFWTDENIVEVSFAARLLFIGMWNFACDNGHVEDKPKQLKMRVFPADNVEIDELIEELVEARLISRGGGFITIPKLGEHQRIDRRYFTTCDAPHCVKTAPAAPAPVVDPSSTRRADPLRAPSTHVDGDGDGDGDGELMVSKGASNEADPPKKNRRGTRIKPNWMPSPEVIDTLKTEYPNLDLKTEHADFVDYWLARPGQAALKLDWDATWRRWMRKAGKEQAEKARSGFRNQDQIMASNAQAARARDTARAANPLRDLLALEGAAS